MKYTINVESEALACDQALFKVENEINVLKLQKGLKVLKVIHGYGSSGVGGKIKTELHLLLKNLMSTDKILDFVPSEKFTTNNILYKKYTKIFPSLILDSDLKNLNPGITLIFFD